MRTIENLQHEADSMRSFFDSPAMQNFDSYPLESKIDILFDIFCRLLGSRRHDLLERIADLKREAGDE